MSLSCKEFAGMIPDFLGDRLGDAELAEFLHHWESCENCKEELSINYLVMEGLERLETGEAFNLQKDLRAEIDGARNRLRKRTSLARASMGIEILTIAAFILVMSVVLFV